MIILTCATIINLVMMCYKGLRITFIMDVMITMQDEVNLVVGRLLEEEEEETH